MSTATQERPTTTTVFETFARQPDTKRGFNFRETRLGETIGKLSFDPIEAERLRQLDVSQQRAELSKNLEGFQGEVLDDIPVSHLYHYYYDGEGNVYNHPDKKPIHRFETQFDPRERDGLPAKGFKRATDMMFQNPDITTLWYSPAGRATSDEDPANPYADVTFIYGQLYVMNFDGEKINGVAIKVDREGERAIEQFMPDRFAHADTLASDYERIEFFLQNPVALGGTVDELAALPWKDGRVYSGKEEGAPTQNFTVRQLTQDLRSRFKGESQNGAVHELVKNLTAKQLGDKNEIAKVYLRMILNHSSMQQDGKTSLKGACGGSNVTQSEIEKLLGVDSSMPTSSSYRSLTQGDGLKQMLANLETSSTHYEDYECPKCHTTFKGEEKGSDRSTWAKECKCGHKFQC